MESEQPFEYEVYLRCQPRQEPCSLIGGSGEYHGLIAGGICNCASPEGDHHYERGDHEYARYDGQADLDTRLSTVKESIEDFNESCLRGFLPIIGFCLILIDGVALHDCVLFLERRVFLADEVLHQTGGYNAAYHCSQESDNRCEEISLADHEHNHDQTHSECCSEVGEGD